MPLDKKARGSDLQLMQSDEIDSLRSGRVWRICLYGFEVLHSWIDDDRV